MTNDKQNSKGGNEPMLNRTFKTTKSLWKSAQHKALDLDLSMGEVLRRLIAKWVKGEVDI